MNGINETSVDTLCAALAGIMGIPAPQSAAPANGALMEYADKVFGGGKADRVFMYNPDAIAQWIYEKYSQLFREADAHTELKIPFCTVMPSVTPVCFGTMYTGAQPAVHGIRRYEKPVIKIDTLFDVLIRCGKKPVIIAYGESSMGLIYKERQMDYFVFDTVEQVNAKAAQLILEDKYDFYAVYNGNYDTYMHKFGPEGIEALAEIKANSRTYGMFADMIAEHWTNHNTLMAFAMDHGCHAIDDNSGSHGLDMPEDLNIVHLYKAYPHK